MEEFFKQLTKQIKDCEKIIFMTHQNMDLDGFASILALSEVADAFKKGNYISINNKFTNTSINKSLDKLKSEQLFFNSLYNKNNIVQDDIFSVLENYVARHDMPFELLRYPIGDAELCACTFIRQGRMFVMINSAIPLSKQIFAAAHELYHIFCYRVNGKKKDF